MNPSPSPSPSPEPRRHDPEASGAEAPSQRSTSRAVQNMLRCNLGEVLDISSQGLRVKCMKMPKPRTEVVLTDYTRPGQLFANVIWSKPMGNFHHEVGLKFEKISREMQERLKEIAKNPRYRRAG